MVDKCRLCAVFALLATCLLSLLGIALLCGYDYLPASDPDQAALTCFYAAGIYAVIAVGALWVVVSRVRRQGRLSEQPMLVEMQSESGGTWQAEER